MTPSFDELWSLHLVGSILGAAAAVEAVPEFVEMMAFGEGGTALHRGSHYLSSGYLCEAR